MREKNQHLKYLLKVLRKVQYQEFVKNYLFTNYFIWLKFTENYEKNP